MNMPRGAINTLSLVFSPLSNQECEWLRNDRNIRRITAESKLYMIGHRREVRFQNLSCDEAHGAIVFDVSDGVHSVQGVRLPLSQFKVPRGYGFDIEMSEQLIRISKLRPGTALGTGKIIHWFTPHRLAFYYWRRQIEVYGFSEFRKFTNYKLYYVGISLEGDSFTRLFETAHEKRSRILGNESQLAPTARLTDELVIFLFDVKNLSINIYSSSDDEELVRGPTPMDHRRLIADAEKAFINILKAQYNTVVYPNYPRSTDGLWGAGIQRYGFIIDECVSFTTPNAAIQGARFYDFNPLDQPDMIAIENESVQLYTPQDMADRVRRMREG